jgi:hypothetical protein
MCGVVPLVFPLLPLTHPLPKVCREWEDAAAEAEQRAGVRTVVLRTGIVLASDGGALGKMLPVFEIFAGGPLGGWWEGRCLLGAAGSGAPSHTACVQGTALLAACCTSPVLDGRSTARVSLSTCSPHSVC